MRNPIKLSFRLLFPLAAMLAIASCQSGELDIQGPEAEGQQKELREVIITASISDAPDETRTSYNEAESKNYWTPGDKIKIFSAGEASEFTSINNVPETMVKFRGLISFITGTSNDDEDSKDYVWGLYPYSEAAAYFEPYGISRTARITTTYSTVQTGVAGTFGDNLTVMIGRSESLSIPFRGAYSGAFFQVSRDDIVSMTLRGLNNEVLAGKATIGLNNSLLPVVYNVTNGSSSVTVTAPNGTFEPGKNYYIITLPDVALPRGYSVTLRRSDGYEGTYELRANRPLNRIKFRNLSDPVDVRIEDAQNIANGVSTGWVPSAAPDVNEIWYTTTDEEAITYQVQSNTGNQIDQIIAPKDNDGLGVIRFTGPVLTIDESALGGRNTLLSVSLSDAVQEISTSAFEYSQNLSEVHLGKNLKKIDSWAFAATSISEIDLPDGLQIIGACAFSECPLTTVTIPETVESLGYHIGAYSPLGNPFWMCSNILQFKGKWATDDGRSLVWTNAQGKRYLISTTYGTAGETYQIPEVEVISFFALSGCRFGQVILPQSLEMICDAAFNSCKQLTSVTIPSGVTCVSGSSFSNCTSLEWVRIDATAVPATVPGVHYYNGNIFSNTTCPIYVPASLIAEYKTATNWAQYAERYVPIPDSKTILYKTSDEEAVTYTVSLSSGNTLSGTVVAPKDNGGIGMIQFTSPITEVDEGALRLQTNLTSVVLPDNVTTIGTGAFYGCNGLSDIGWSTGLTTIGSNAFFMTGFQKISIPEGVTTIGGAAFGACTVLKSVVLPQSLTSIGVSEDQHIINPFMHCLSLERFQGKFASSDGRCLVTQYNGKTVFLGAAQSSDIFILPTGIEQIAAYALSGIHASNIVLPEGLKVISDYAFLGCEGIQSLTIPSSVEIVGGSAFSSCSSLNTVYMLPNTVPSAVGVIWGAGDMFDSTADDLVIYVPSNLLSTYKTTTYWSDYEDRYMIEQAPYEIWYTTTDGQAAQYSLPDSYSQYAANMSNTAPSSNLNNPGIGVLKFPINLTEIPQGLFTGCTNLETVYIPKGVESIGTYGFRNCYNLVAVYVRDPGNLSYIGDNAFVSCSKLKTLGNTEGIVNLPAVTSVGKYALYNMYMVEEVHFPNLVDAAAGNAFNCMGLNTTLRTMDVPKLEYCDGWYTFGNITLDNLYLPSIKTLGMFSFGYSQIGSIRFGPNLQSMGNYCFTNAPEMSRTLYFEGTTPPTFNSATFFIDYQVNTQLVPLEAIHVPHGCAAAYQNALHTASAAYDAYFSVIIDDL